MRVALIACALLLPGAAQAECLTAADLAQGIDVTVEGGIVYHYRAAADGAVTSTGDEVQAGNGHEREMTWAQGIFVTHERLTEREVTAPDVVGGNEGGTITLTTDPRRRLPKVAPGAVWAGKVDFRQDQDGPSIGPQDPITARLAAEMTFLDEKTVTISGCAYRILPVETRLTLAKDSRPMIGETPMAELTGEEPPLGVALLTRRQIHFLDLGFSVMTREGSETGGLPETARGITGMARSGG